MNRYRAGILLGLALFLLAALGWWVLGYEPAFYRAALAEHRSHEEHVAAAKAFTRAALQLEGEMRDEDRWSKQFSEEAINGWLAEELPGRFSGWLPKGVEQPRIHFEEDALYVGFRTKKGLWSGVVSAKLRVWVAGPNQLACEVDALSAGLLPVPADDLLQDLVDGLNAAGWRVEWKSGDRADILLVRLGRDGRASEDDDTPVLEAIEVASGRLSVAGRRGDSGRVADEGPATAFQTESGETSATKR